MDGLSGAASGIAVVSLTFQVVEGISKLRDFFESVKSAPAEVALITKDLKELAAILDSISVDEQRYNNVLTTCMAKIEGLNAITDELEPGFQQSVSKKDRQWTAFRTARKGMILKKFRETLEVTKITLILALQTKNLSLSQSNASRLTLIERRLCEDRIASQRDTFELLVRQEQHSACVNSLVNLLTNLSVEHKSRLVSTKSDHLNLLDHSADLGEEIARMTTAIQNPMARRAFEASIKTVLNSHLETIVNEQRISQQASSFAHQESHATPHSTAASSDDNDNTCIQCIKKKSALPPENKPVRKLKRQRLKVQSTASVRDFFGGRIYISTATYQVRSSLSSNHASIDSNDLLEHETLFAYHPARWLLRRGVNFGVNALLMKAAQGWQYHIRTFRAVPDDSLIFDFCRNGNLDGVRSLLARGEASPWDVDSEGWTPLHTASGHFQVEVCELLLGQGADPTARTYRLEIAFHQWPRSALAIALDSSSRLDATYSDYARLAATLRLFSGRVKLLEERDLDVLFFRYFSWCDLLGKKIPSGCGEIVKSALELCRSELQEDGSRWALGNGCIEAVHFLDLNLVKDMLTTLDIDVELVAQSGGFSMLHDSLDTRYRRSENEHIEVMKTLMDHGANVHRLGEDLFEDFRINTGLLPGVYSPTMLAMRQSASFFCWRRVLNEQGYCLRNFLIRELQTSSLALEGWTEDTLFALFEYEFEPYWPSDRFVHCQKCESRIIFRRELAWMITLEMIKEGRILEVQGVDHRSAEGRLSRRDIYESCVSGGWTVAGSAVSIRSRMASAQQLTDTSDSDDDEYVDIKPASTSGNWPWQSVCDWCINDEEDETGDEEDETGDEEDETGEENEDEDFQPQMPGGFDF